VTSCGQIACQLFVCKIREGDSTPSLTIRAQHFRDSASEYMLSLTLSKGGVRLVEHTAKSC
jgi:hypothetical protein